MPGDDRHGSGGRPSRTGPCRPSGRKLRGTAQNPDVFFQAREACNPFYDDCAGIVQKHMDKFAKLIGRQYHLFDYIGAPDAERVIVVMGSGSGVVEETVDKLVGRRREGGPGEGPALPPVGHRGLRGRACPRRSRRSPCWTARRSPAPPASRSIRTWLRPWPRAGRRSGNGSLPKVIGGRYGLSSKEFTPAMVAAVYDELTKPQPKRHFTVGINDDVTNLSLDYDADFSTEKRRRDPRRVLRPRQRRHRQRQPQLGEDHRREHAAARPGLFRLRLAQGRLGHHLARPLQPAADQGLVPGPPGELRRLPPVPVPRADRHALDGRCRGRRSC